MHRRNFIKNTGFVSSGFMLTGNISLKNFTSVQNIPSITEVMRWAQLAFVENDPGNYDPNFWLNYFKRIHAQGALLSAGGVVAFYPTNIPLHHRSQWMGNSDPLGYLIN